MPRSIVKWQNCCSDRYRIGNGCCMKQLLRIHVRKASVLPDEIPEEIAMMKNAEEIILSFAKIDSKDMEKAFQLFADHK